MSPRLFVGKVCGENFADLYWDFISYDMESLQEKLSFAEAFGEGWQEMWYQAKKLGAAILSLNEGRETFGVAEDLF